MLKGGNKESQQGFLEHREMPSDEHNPLCDCHVPFEEDRQICSHTWLDGKGPVVMPYIRYQGHGETLALA